MFIVTEFGIPHVADSLNEPRRLSRLALIKRSWQHCFAFDVHQRYKRIPTREPAIGLVQSLLAHLIYNPETDITARWEPSGSYALSDIITEVEKGLANDDDIIQQWFEADD